MIIVGEDRVNRTNGTKQDFKACCGPFKTWNGSLKWMIIVSDRFPFKGKPLMVEGKYIFLSELICGVEWWN